MIGSSLEIIAGMLDGLLQPWHEAIDDPAKAQQEVLHRNLEGYIPLFKVSSVYSNHILPSATACSRKNAFTTPQSIAFNKGSGSSCSARSK